MFESKVIDYKGYGKCLYMSNGIVEVVETLDLGPRIVRYGFVDGVNIINDNLDKFQPTTSETLKKFYGENATYCTYGGHRLWISPEYYPETYYPDNNPVEYELIENGAVFTQELQKENGLQFKITVTLDPDDTNVEVKHEITNLSDRIKEFAPWALTVAAEGGLEIIPMNTNETHLLPNRKVELWNYTDLRKDNIFIGKKYASVKQPEEHALKLGFDLMNGSVYYIVEDTVFIKRYHPNYPNGIYPDGGVSYETYSCNYFTELETLGELKKVAIGETVCHIENWSLCKKPCDVDIKDEDSIDAFIAKL